MEGEEESQHMWWHAVGSLLVLAMIGSASDGALCPSRCRCNDELLKVSCALAALEVVPIQLNPEVRHIDLSNNKINNVHFTLTFYNNLITLDLSNNKIRTLGSGNFLSQKNLKNLNLSHNEMENLHKDSFKGLRAIKSLDLSFNRLEELNSATFRELHSLQFLKLTGNHLDYLDEGIFKASKHLEEIYLDDNQFLQVPTFALIDVINLNFLSLSRNLIALVNNSDMPNLPELKTLLLDNNDLTEIHHSSLSGLFALDHLDLSDNNFTIIPTASLSKLSNLTKLKFSGNFITTLPPVAFRGLFQLRFLQLDRLELLEKVDSRAFVDNINLEKVWLDDNIALEKLPTRLFHGNPRVTHISIRNNRLVSLEVTHFPIDQLHSLRLGDNPLQCNCSLLWLWYLTRERKLSNKKPVYNETVTQAENAIQTEAELLIDIEDISCAGPEPLEGSLLVDTTESQIDCSLSWIAVISVSATTVFILAMIAVVIYLGPIRRSRTRSMKSDLETTNSDCQVKTVSHCSNGRTERYDSSGIRHDKYISPPLVQQLHHEYRSLPSWDPYAECASSNVCQQFDRNPKTRPHIVYV